MKNPASALFSGHGEVRSLLRKRDWSGFPFGPPERWPPIVRQTIDMLLHTPAPMSFLWGDDLLYFYNDAYTAILADKHPAALAGPLWENWHEHQDEFAPIVRKAQDGEACILTDMPFPVARGGTLQQGYFTYTLLPVFDAAGGVTGILAITIETTMRVLSNRRQEFQLGLADLVRPLTDPHEVIARASELLGRCLAADRVVYALVDDTGDTATIERDWTSGRLPTMAGSFFHLDEFGPALADAVRAGTSLVLGDVKADERSAAFAKAYTDLGLQAVLVIPLMKQGRLRALLNVHHVEPHAWTRVDVDIAEDMADRTWSAVESARSQAELREADRRKDEFLAMLAHELRNPLAPIGAAAELLQHGKLDEASVLRTSQVIGRQVRHMTSLVDDLLDVSRVTRGLVELRMDRLDLRHIVTEAIEQITPLIRARRHHLALALPPDAPIVLGDRKRLVQVLANLLNNAAKYTDEGGHIGVETDVRDDHVLVHVVDNGIGMTPELARRAFDLFSQAERSSDRSLGGLGLGLALVKSLIELHHGTVHCRSDGPGKGSTFTVCLPRAEPEPAGRAPIGGKEPDPSRTGGPLRIMVVDDNVDAASMLAMLLEAAGHQVLVEHSPLQALARSRAEAPRVFLLDIGLPQMDGYELARRLRAQPETAGALLIAVTGYGQDSDRAQTAAAGFDHHLVKPVDLPQLYRLLARVAP
ncbi:response regulator [Massilia dura]|uniref:histidine kinase n=1 Tax=Pseudoduganella dura TaxID=321982 RepID=A0A6I3X5G7_9BURK|nr:ATP-binding protein [Pseudoduganella dura]MUI11437.1 response regulator [Pseudoduganella dura]GGX97742.1 hypothetical protein GCM10007386_30930 [Pseudoduganella dura]